MKTLYLIAAIFGALIPYIFFIDFFSVNSLGEFYSALFVNGAAAGATADLLIASLVFWAFMWSRKQTGPSPIPFVLLNLLIGLSCALPAYLYFNERHA